MGKWSPSSNQQARAITKYVCLVGVCLCALGCGPAPKAVEGTVTLDGASLNEAVVMFVPLEHGRAKTGAKIENGKYTLDVKEGLLPAQYRVEILDNGPLRPTRPMPRSDEPTGGLQHKSSLRLDVPAGGASGRMVADFELKSTPAPAPRNRLNPLIRRHHD